MHANCARPEGSHTVSTTARVVITYTHGNTRNTHELYTFSPSDAFAFLVRTKFLFQKTKDKVKACCMLGRSFTFCEYLANPRVARLVMAYTRCHLDGPFRTVKRAPQMKGAHVCDSGEIPKTRWIFREAGLKNAHLHFGVFPES